MGRQCNTAYCLFGILLAWQPLSEADQPMSYVDASGRASYRDGQVQGFGFGSAQTVFRFNGILLEDAPAERSEVGEFLHWLSDAGAALVGSLFTHRVVREDFALIVDGHIQFSPRFDRLLSAAIQPCGDGLCADIELCNGEHQQGQLWFQVDSRRDLLLRGDDGVMRKVPLKPDSWITLAFDSACR